MGTGGLHAVFDIYVKKKYKSGRSPRRRGSTRAEVSR
jgi:hypothetical protein